MISEIQIQLTKPHEGIIGFASCIINKSLYIGGIAIHSKLNGTGYRLTYPTRKRGNQSFHIFHPINAVFSKQVEQAVFEKLKEVMTQTDDRYDSNYP